MPICIECRYPVPQLYHVLHSTSKPSATPATTPSSTSHQKSASNGSQQITTAASIASINEGTRGGGEAAKKSSGGSDVRLTQCPRCKRFADKYVEHDFVVLFIDLVLVKPQVYRHLLFNRLGRDDDAFDPSIVRLGILLLLFDVYLTWSNIEALPHAQTSSSPIPHLPIIIQYLFFLLLSLATTLAQHLTIRFFARLSIFGPSSAPTAHISHSQHPIPATAPLTTPGPGSTTPLTTPSGAGPLTTPVSASASNTNLHATFTASTSSTHLPPQLYQNPTSPHMPPPQTPLPSASSNPPSLPSAYPPGPAAISTALFVSSCMKLFPILMVVWKYDEQGAQVARGVGWAVAVQNVEALRILLGIGYLKAAVLVGLGKGAAEGVGMGLLKAVGLS